MKRIIVLSILTIIVLFSCKTVQKIECHYPETECLALGVSFRLKIVDQNDKPVILDNWYTKFIRTEKIYKNQTSDLVNGSYAIINYELANTLRYKTSCEKDSIVFVGKQKGKTIVTEGFTFRQAPCGLELIKGAKIIKVNIN